MASETGKSIWIVADETADSSPVTGERAGEDIGGGFGRRGPSPAPAPRRFEVSFEQLKENTTGFLEMVGELFSQAAERAAPGMALDEVELAVEINGEGQLSLLGTGSKMGGKGAITLKFKRM